MDNIQSIKIRKNYVPFVEAEKIAKRLSGSRKHHIFRETPKYYFFRILPKTHFKKNSLFTKKYNKDISIIFGELDLYYAGSIIDVVKDPLGTIKEAFRSVPSKLNNISRGTLEKYGNNLITNIRIARTPINRILQSGLNTMTMGKLNEIKNDYGYNNLFHLSLIVDVEDPVIIEKNEVVNIEPLKTINKNSEYMQVAINKNRTLNELIDNTLQHMGSSKFYDYDAFYNNCQIFILSILESNSMLTNREKDFIDQNAEAIGDELQKTGFGFISKFTRGITKIGSIASRLIGTGAKKKKKHNKKYYDNIKKWYKIVADMIDKRKFKFL